MIFIGILGRKAPLAFIRVEKCMKLIYVLFFSL